MIVGGADNLIDFLDLNATIIGGQDNVASEDFSVVGGGQGNSADGDHSVVSGGLNRTASGQHDWVAGSQFEDN